MNNMYSSMKKTILTMLLCMAAMTGMADEQKKITLSNDNTKETINLSYCNIFVTLANPDSDDDRGKVLIEIENLDETKILALFHKEYTEKQLKRMRPRFQYDKLFGGTKGRRVAEPYNLDTDKDIFFEPTNKYALPFFETEPDKQTVVRLPIYIAKSKKKGVIQRILGKEKLLLLRKQVIELDIEVAMKPSAEYLGLEKNVDDLKKDLDQTVFCTHRSHKPTLDKQQEPYVKKIEELKAKIDAAISAHGWQEGDSGYRRYTALKEKMDKELDLDAHKGLCRKHRVPTNTHSCSYCSLSLQQIYHKLDDLYKKIYTSSDRQATKASVMGQVNALYNCCTAADCAKHAQQWSRGGDYKNKIIERYNRIQGL